MYGIIGITRWNIGHRIRYSVSQKKEKKKRIRYSGSSKVVIIKSKSIGNPLIHLIGHIGSVSLSKKLIKASIYILRYLDKPDY